jgi:hypothetical protein
VAVTGVGVACDGGALFHSGGYIVELLCKHNKLLCVKAVCSRNAQGLFRSGFMSAVIKYSCGRCECYTNKIHRNTSDFNNSSNIKELNNKHESI